MHDTMKKGLLVAPAALLTGCGVLGIATKGDLERQRDETAAETREVREELDRVGQEVQGLDGQLATVEASVASLGSVRELVDELSRRLEDTKLRLTIVEGKANQELARLDGEISATAADAAAARDIALTADERGRVVTTAYVDGLRAERRRLQRELDEISEQLDTLASAAGRQQAALPGTERAGGEGAR